MLNLEHISIFCISAYILKGKRKFRGIYLRKKILVALLSLATLVAIFSSPALAVVIINPQCNNLVAASPHYYLEPGPKTADWYTSHKTEVGYMHTWNDGSNLHVEYRTFSSWSLTETHLAVAETVDGIPQTKSGNPKVGNFPYKHQKLGCTTVDEYVIPLSLIGVSPGNSVVIAAHAVVSGPGGEETAWGNCGNSYFSGNNWATYFSYKIT